MTLPRRDCLFQIGAFLARPAVGLTFVFVACALGGYQQVFSTLAPYDDEGYVMLGVVHYLQGLPLYEKIYTQYGPGLFVVEGGFHRLTGLPVTHDVVRFRTLAVWLSTALLGYGIVRRITASPWMGVAAFGASFLHLERLCLEPGHPQEICVLATTAALFLATYLPRGAARGWIPLGIGVLTGLVLMTKLNIGVFLLAGLALAFLGASPPTRGWRRTWLAAMLPAVILPLALMGGQLRDVAHWGLPAAVLSGVAGTFLLALSLFRAETGTDGETCTSSDAGRDLPGQTAAPMCMGGLLSASARGMALIGVTASCALLAATVLVQGASPATLWYGLVGQHRGFAEGPFFHPAPLPEVGLLVAGAGTLLAVAAGRGMFFRPLAQVWVALLVLGAMVIHVSDARSPLLHGLADRGGAGMLVACLTPLAWTVLMPLLPGAKVQEHSTPSRLFGRRVLCCVAVLQPLGAFPLPGTQMAVGSLPLVLIGLIVLDDLAAGAVSIKPRLAPSLAQPDAERFAAMTTPTIWPKATALTVVVMVAGTLAYRDVCLWSYRQSLAPLNLPGAVRLRAPEEIVSQYAWLARVLRENADTFVFGEHTQNSVYFWTGIKAPSALSATVWPYLLRREQQERVVESLRGRQRVCLIRDRFNTLPPPPDAPLGDYLANNFRREASHGRFELWTMAPPRASE